MEAPQAMETLTSDAVVAYARTLVEFVQRASPLQKNPVMYEPFPSWPKEKGVWGVTTRPGINLYDNPQGAEWIDDLGNRGLALADDPSGRTVINHGDWFPHNVRLDENLNLKAVFSWDGINLELETVAVGKACTLGTYDDAMLFIESYDSASNRKFTPDEMRTIAGVATWMRAFLARWSHSQGVKEADSDLQQALRRDGEKLLSLAS